MGTDGTLYPHDGQPALKSTTDPTKSQRGHRTAVKVFPQPGQDLAPADTSVPQVSQKNLAFLDFMPVRKARSTARRARDCQAP